MSSAVGIARGPEELKMPNPDRPDFPDRSEHTVEREARRELTASTGVEPVNTAALLEQIRLRREAIGAIDVSDETIRELRDAGRR